MFLPEDTELIGWDYGDPKIPFPDEGAVYVLDLSPESLMSIPFAVSHLDGRLVWIDHHKSAIERWSPAIRGYRIDGVAACRLTWQWFNNDVQTNEHGVNTGLPVKEAYIIRNVREPLAVRLAGEYDIWDKRDPRAELFQHGLRSEYVEFQQLLHNTLVAESYVETLLKNGSAIQFAQTRQNESVIKEIGFTFQWEGLTFLGCNAARYNSHLFTAGLKPEHDACFGFKWTGKDWSVSLYGVPGKPEIDLSLIAVKYGGGGHKQACGFRTPSLPFIQGGAAATALP